MRDVAWASVCLSRACTPFLPALPFLERRLADCLWLLVQCVHLCPFRELGAVDKILGPLTEVLEGVLQADQQLMEKTKAKVFSAFITVLQMKEMRGEQAA